MIGLIEFFIIWLDKEFTMPIITTIILLDMLITNVLLNISSQHLPPQNFGEILFVSFHQNIQWVHHMDPPAKHDNVTCIRTMVTVHCFSSAAGLRIFRHVAFGRSSLVNKDINFAFPISLQCFLSCHNADLSFRTTAQFSPPISIMIMVIRVAGDALVSRPLLAAHLNII